MKVIIDTIGSDNGSKPLIEAALEIHEEYDLKYVFVGKEDEIENIIQDKLQKKDYEIMNATYSITNQDDPVKSMRNMKDSSIVKSFNKLNEEDSHALISCGSTGALLACATFLTGRIKNVKRIAIGATLPTIKGHTLLIDTGANVDCKPEFLKEFAILGDIYARNVFELKNPKIGLLNIGVEETKGNKLTKEAFKLISQENLNFIGNIEAREIMYGDCDVIVADGFYGNIALKSIEGTAKVLLKEIKSVIGSNLKSKVGGLLVRSALKSKLKKYDYKEVGAAPLLGAKKTVFKAHGNSDKKIFKSALKGLILYEQMQVTKKIKEQFNGQE